MKSIKEANFTTLKHEIIVVDNNSGDGIGEFLSWQHPGVKFIQNEENVGMGAGNNAGIEVATGKYIVIMNPDTIAFGNTFAELYSYMETNPDVGVVGPQQLNTDRSIQDSCYRWHSFLTPLYRRTPLGNLKFAQADLDRYLMKDFDHKEEREVDWLLGSFLFMRTSALKETELFDDRYFMYFEDTDLCRQFWQKGFKVVYNPSVQIIHNHNRQSAEGTWYKIFWNKAARHHVISWLKYFKKWGFKKPIRKI